jgi:ABC-type phosphonate transport system ATPase subunit
MVLAADEPVETVEAAYERVYYYTQRWKIERFHYVLKPGCAAEKLQERSMGKTALLALMYSITAAVIMNLTYTARMRSEKSCAEFFDAEEWKLLYRTANKTKKP